jgi:hypothetical protein
MGWSNDTEFNGAVHRRLTTRGDYAAVGYYGPLGPIDAASSSAPAWGSEVLLLDRQGHVLAHVVRQDELWIDSYGAALAMSYPGSDAFDLLLNEHGVLLAPLVRSDAMGSPQGTQASGGWEYEPTLLSLRPDGSVIEILGEWRYPMTEVLANNRLPISSGWTWQRANGHRLNPSPA